MANKTLVYSWIPGRASVLTANVFLFAGGAVQNASPLTATVDSNASTKYLFLMTDACEAVGVYVEVSDNGVLVDQKYADLREAVGLYPLYPGPTPGQLAAATVYYPIAAEIEFNPSFAVPVAIAQAALVPYQIGCLRGDTLAVGLPLLGTITGWTKILFTAKKKGSDLDASAKIQIGLNSDLSSAGLLILNGAAAAHAADAALVVGNATTGSVNLQIAARATSAFAIEDWFWDVQVITGSAVRTPASGHFKVSQDITLAIN